MSEADRVIEYIRALLVSGYTWNGKKHYGIGMVVEENQRRIGLIPNNVWNTKVKRAKPVPALQELADTKTISLAVQGVVNKLAAQNGLTVNQIRDAVNDGVTSALGELNTDVIIDITEPEPDLQPDANVALADVDVLAVDPRDDSARPEAGAQDPKVTVTADVSNDGSRA